MTRRITLENTILANSGKRGILKPIESTPGGDYYLLNAGGFNITNRSGITYRFNEYVKECSRPDSELNRRVTNGQLYAELGHPTTYYLENVNGQVVRTKITDLFEWINRLKTIMDDRVCGHIRRIHWDIPNGDNGPVYNSIEICPFGPYGYVLDTSLKNPDINSAVSIRTVTTPQKIGDRVREVAHFSTYDLVFEQGMLRACKHLSDGLESLASYPVANDENLRELSGTFDEFITVAELRLNSLSEEMRMAGNESLNLVSNLIKDLKSSNSFKTPVKLINTNSLSAFL